MKKYARAVRPGLSFLAIAVLCLVPTVGSAQSAVDSEDFSGFLAEAKTGAVPLQKNAEEMNSFVHYMTHWSCETRGNSNSRQQTGRIHRKDE